MIKTESDDYVDVDIEKNNRKESKFRKLRRYITVEPVSFALNVPYFLLVICLQNLTLEKVGQ